MSKELTLEFVGEQVDKLVMAEIDARPGLGSQGKIDLLYQEAKKKAGSPLCMQAAKAITKSQKKKNNIIVSTGWVIPFWYPHGEMCGMVGTVALTRALVSGLSSKVLFISEDVVLPVYEATCRTAGLRTYRYGEAGKIPLGVMTEPFPTDVKKAKTKAESILNKFQPSAIITLERCARNEKGVYHTGAGNDMSSSTAKIDYLVEAARELGIPTVGVGDLGNEIGMGSIEDAVREVIPYGDRCRCDCKGGIASAIPTDITVVASSSSRGGYGIAACISSILKDPELPHDSNLERRMIETAVRMGAIDSFTVNPTLTDGHGMSANVSGYLVELLRQLIRAQFTKYPMYEARERSGG